MQTFVSTLHNFVDALHSEEEGRFLGCVVRALHSLAQLSAEVSGGHVPFSFNPSKGLSKISHIKLALPGSKQLAVFNRVQCDTLEPEVDCVMRGPLWIQTLMQAV
jgi:hypothetical protein